MKKLPIITVVLLSVLSACTKDRTKLIDDANNNGPFRNFILINEFMAKETKAPSLNELGVAADWIELFNPGTDTLHLVKGKWFITDDFNLKGKYLLPTMNLLPGAHLVIWCDHGDTIPGLHDIHANFGLSASGEQIGVYYINPEVLDTLPYDTKVFGVQTADISEGRLPDGSDTWTTFTTPTPGTANH